MPAQKFAFELNDASKGILEGIHSVLENIAIHYFGEQTNLVTFSDVKLPNYGTIDFVLARHKPCNSEIDDFVLVEVGAFLHADKFAVEDVLGHAFPQSARYERTIRTSLFQLLDRGIVYEVWGVKSYWVIPESVYANMVKRFGFKQGGFSAGHAVRFALQDISTERDRVNIKTTRYASSSVDEIYQALRNDSGLPSKTRFIVTLNDRLKRTLVSGIRMKFN